MERTKVVPVLESRATEQRDFTGLQRREGGVYEKLESPPGQSGDNREERKPPAVA